MTSCKQAVFRADSSAVMGSGHVMRCLTLADALAGQGYAVSFICRELPGNIIDAVTARGYCAHRLPYRPDVAWETDAGETADVLKTLAGRADLLVVDHYALDERWEKKIKPLADKLLVIDDLADRRHDCHFLLDQNLSTMPPKDYRPLVPAGCILLLGTGYTLLRPDFARLRRANRSRDGAVRRLLVFFGGGDQENETGKALAAIKELDGDLAVDAVLGGGNPHRAELEKLYGGLENISIHFQTAEMAQIMAQADLSVGGCGSATWERCSLGLPSICTALAPNQEAIAMAAAAAGAVLYLGKAADVSSDDIKSALQKLLAEPKTVLRMAERAAQAVDGYGTERVIKALGLSHFDVTIVSDARSWMNDHIPDLVTALKERGHAVRWIHEAKDIPNGDLVFLLGCGEIVSPAILQRNKHNIVIHASALPKGRGWSPFVWQIIEGSNSIPVTMLEAAHRLDSGDIYATETVELTGCELIDDIRLDLVAATARLCLRFVDEYPEIVARRTPQQGEASYYRLRNKADSRLDADRSIAAQFNLLRVVDNEAYPAFFELNGCRYFLKIYRDKPEADEH